MRPRTALACLVLLTSGCTMAEEAPTSDEMLLVNARVYTVNDAQPWAEAVLVVDGKIAAIGSDEAVRAEASDEAEVVDLGGAFVMPGLHDIHSHPLEARSPFAGTCLLDHQQDDPEAFISVLEACAPTQIGTDWVLGSGHSVFTLLEAERLPVEILDEAIPDRPAAILEEASHSVWVSSLALAAAEITASSENPPGGVIVKHPSAGEPTGLLFRRRPRLRSGVAADERDPGSERPGAAGGRRRAK